MIIHDRIRLTAIKHMKGVFGNEGALRFYYGYSILRQTMSSLFRRSISASTLLFSA